MTLMSFHKFHRPGLVTALLLLIASPVFADEDSKPPIIIQTPTTKYIISSDSEKFREILLRADRIKIRTKPDDAWQEKYYRNYSRHHRKIGEHEKPSYYTGHAVGHVLKD